MSPPTMPPTSTNDFSLSLSEVRLSERPFQRLHDQTATAYPVKMPDPIRKRFLLRLVMAITANLQPESGRIVYAGSDFPHPFQPRFSKEGMDHIVQNRPGSDLVVCRNQQARVLPECNRPAASFPLSDAVLFFHRRPG